MTKDYMQTHCKDGYEVVQTTFNELSELLENNAAYTPFVFKNGVRGKANVQGGTKWIVLDIDDSAITDEECHLMLDHINHHIARTSDKTNPFKFRALIELDSEIDIPELKWKPFIKLLSEEIGVTADLLPKSQIYFSYADRNILSITNTEPLEVKPILDRLANSKDTKPVTSLPKAQKASLLNDPMGTFDYAFNAPEGIGSVSIIRACLHAKDLGASKDEVLLLAHSINDFWDEPMDEQRFSNTIATQINRWNF